MSTPIPPCPAQPGEPEDAWRKRASRHVHRYAPQRDRTWWPDRRPGRRFLVPIVVLVFIGLVSLGPITDAVMDTTATGPSSQPATATVTAVRLQGRDTGTRNNDRVSWQEVTIDVVGRQTEMRLNDDNRRYRVGDTVEVTWAPWGTGVVAARAGASPLVNVIGATCFALLGPLLAGILTLRRGRVTPVARDRHLAHLASRR